MQDNNPDSVLAVRFYEREMPQELLSELEGRPIMHMRDFVRIQVPGDLLTVIDTFVNEEHKKRFPQQWAQYLNDRNAETQVQGTLLKDWSILTPAQATELRHFKFYTVEQVAAASDQQIMAIGMMLGISPQTFREKARAYLANAKDSAVVMSQAEELRKRDQQIADLQAQVERLAQATPERRPGRPRKETKEAA